MMPPGSSFDYNKLRREAQSRWLKPSEVFFILQNHVSFPIEEEAPEKPLSGSLFLFNRRVLRFFRKDGHRWRKKKDGRGVGEAHEQLKVGNIDALNCYYARGELNPYFQRRIYWMLNPDYAHIVLVHYREASEGRFLPPIVSQQQQEQLSSLNESSNLNNIQFEGLPSATSEMYPNQISGSSVSGEVNSKNVGKKIDIDCLNMINISESSDPSSQAQALHELEEQLSLDKYDDNILGDLIPVYTKEFETPEGSALLDSETWNSFQLFHENFIPTVQDTVYDQGVNVNQKCQTLDLQHTIQRKNSPSSNNIPAFSSRSRGIDAHGRSLDSMDLPDGPETSCYKTSANGTYHSVGNALKNERDFRQISSEKENIFGAPIDQLENFSLRQLGHAADNAEYMACGSDLILQLSASRRFPLDSDSLYSPNSFAHMAADEQCNASGTTSAGSNSKVVSVQKENSNDWMGTIDLPNTNTAYSSDLYGLWFEQGQHGTSFVTEPSLTVAQKQLFRIREISPEWSFSSESTKVVITGDFLCSPSAYPWAVMFGKVEVPVEIVQQGVFRCHTPEQITGKVTLCITSGNRESCSEVREFDFRTKPVASSIETLHHANASKNSKELLLLVKFVHVLLCRFDDLSVSKAAGQTETEYHQKFKAAEEQWLQILEHLQSGSEISSGTVDWIVQELIKDKFEQWLLSKTNAKEDGNCLLSKEEQSIIHKISGLGYEWALNPILDAGVQINFRDHNGWTALHWAARFGREKMAAALLAAGALAGAVTDPTPGDSVGKTAGAIAAASGHKGLAGYLSEADLTSHLSSLTLEECEIYKGSAAVDAEKTVQNISERSAQLYVGGTEDDLSLKDSLAAVRNAAQAAARIQAAFRAHSFRKRQKKAFMNDDEYGMTSEDIYGLTASSKIQRAIHSYHGQKFDKAALSIQKRYRGWKGRKSFLTLRHHAVKIQAHVRGHQRRKKYKEWLWASSVLEKAILRWRRRGVGLRGFQAEQDLANEGEEEEDIVKVFRKHKVGAALDQALSRVLSMVECPRARQQYRRMLEIYRQAKAEYGSAEDAISRLQDNFEMMQDDDALYGLK